MGNAVMNKEEARQFLGVDEKRLSILMMMGDLKILYRDPMSGQDMFSISSVELLNRKINRGEIRY